MRDAPVRTTELNHGITAIDTDYVRPLLDASHLIVQDGRGAFVDTGTNSSVPLLLAALREANLAPADVDYVFLTHVHLDHAGGAGRLMQALPNARAILHPRGARHMSDPSRLAEGAKVVYGAERFAEMYGEPVPIPADRIDVAADGDVFEFRSREFRVFHTEGHARHHYCLADPASDGVFTGDSFGISYREFDTAAGEFIYPTTTPVHFDPAEAHKSIDRIMSYEPQAVYLTHYSRVSDLPRLADDMHRRIDDFVAIATRHANERERTERIQESLYRSLLDALEGHGVAMDAAAAQEVVRMDVELNTMGLEHWLDHDA